MRNADVNWAVADQACVSSANFITGVLVVRLMGVSSFGEFTLVWMIVQFVQSIQYAVIAAPMMSIGTKCRDDDSSVYYGAVVIHQALHAIVSLVVLSLAWAIVSSSGFFGNTEQFGGALLVLVLLSQMHEFLRRYFFSRARPAVSFLGDLARYASQVVLLAWLVLTRKAACTVTDLLMWLSAFALFGTCLMASCVKRLALPSWSDFRSITARNWMSTRWLLAAAILTWASGNFVLIAVGAILGTSAVGIMRAGQNIMGVTHILFQGLENVLPRRAAIVLVEQGQHGLRRFTNAATVYVGGFTAAIAAMLCAAPGTVMSLIYGSSFRGYGWVLVCFAVVYTLMSLGLAAQMALRALERTLPIFATYALTSALSLPLSYPLVSHFALVGALGTQILLAMITSAVPLIAMEMYRRAERAGSRPPTSNQAGSSVAQWVSAEAPPTSRRFRL